MEVKSMLDNNNEIKLTTTNNTTSNGTPFPTTPPPQVLKENFASVELTNTKQARNSNGNNSD